MSRPARSPEAVRLLLEHALETDALVLVRCRALDGTPYFARGHVVALRRAEVVFDDEPTPVVLRAIVEARQITS